MISIKDYAGQKNVSYEAIRKQIKRYKGELEGHIFKDGRTQLLDEVAVDFLDEKRQTNPVVIYETNREEELEQLKEENKTLLLKIANLQEELLREKDHVKKLQAEQIQLLHAATQKHKGLLQRLFNRS